MFQNLFRNMPGVVKNLLILNVLMALAFLTIPEHVVQLALRYPTSPEFEPFQFATHFFMHARIDADPTHIIFNMIGLVIFGSMLERVWGPKRFLVFYLVCALGAAGVFILWKFFIISGMEESITSFTNDPSAPQFIDYLKAYFAEDFHKEYNPEYYQMVYSIKDAAISYPDQEFWHASAENIMTGIKDGKVNSPMLGASGAVYGVLIGFAMLFPNTEIMLLIPPIPIKAKYLALILVGLALFSGWMNNSGDNVAHFAHLGGALFGAIMVLIWRRNRNQFY